MKIRQVVGMVGRTLRVLIEPGSLVELRVPQSEKGAQCGLFDDRNEMAVAAAKLSRKVPGVFFTLNPVKPSAGKAANQIGTATRAVRDADILCRRWLDLDFDPVRPGKCPAKKGEHETAIATARECRNFLRALGWPEPVLADSGNGAHLYYRIALSNDEESDALVKAVLKALTLRFSTPKVTLDEGNGNASRLTRVFGTMNCKGEETEHRVYRRARLLKVPEKIDVVSPKLLKQLVAKLPPRSVNTVGQQLDVGKWLSDHNVPIAFHAPWNRGHKWVLASCPWNEAHEKSAVVVQFADGGIAALCLHKSCSGKGWPQMRKMLGDVNRNPLLPVGGQRNRQTSQIIDLVARDIRPYRSLQGDAYVAVDFDDHSKNYGVGTKAFHQYLMGKYYEAFQIVPQPGAIQQAVTHFSALAQLEGPVEPVFIRAGNYGQAYYLDLGNDHWEAVEFSKDGWAVVKKPPVHFRRAQGMLPLPRPSEKGDINELREFVNIGTDEAWLLFVACLVSAILPRGPHPILGIHGEQGSGKTTVAKIFRQMIDPNSVPLRAMPKDIRDFAVAAHNSWVVSFDNLSFLPVWFSDSLCRLSSGGGGFSTRMLYTDSEEAVFEGQRPIVLNGIEELATRADLIDRAVLLELPIIRKYRPEKDFWPKFDAAHPQLLGGLLDFAVQVLEKLPTVKLPQPPRMADFARAGTAAEAALRLPHGTFMRAYTANRKNANAVALEASTIANLVCELAREQRGWEGTASDLLDKLSKMTTEDVRNRRGWPGNGKVLSGMLRRLAAPLRLEGVEVEFFSWENTQKQHRVIKIRRAK